MRYSINPVSICTVFSSIVCNEKRIQNKTNPNFSQTERVKVLSTEKCKISGALFLFILLQFMNLSAQNPVNPYKAPLYWDVYENNYLKEKAGISPNYITEDDWLANINWVDINLKKFGYKIICIDGWGDVDFNQYGYRTRHSSMWTHDYAWWSTYLQSKGMTLGIYDNPLWVSRSAASSGIKVKGTNILLSTLINNSENATWFTWLQVDRAGAQEYVKGYVQHYADMGVKYLRVDFLSWFESGWDRYMGTVGPIRTLASYQTSLQWMREACDANGIFLSLVMPNLYGDGVTEQKYGHMVRIDEDCAEGGWSRFSENARGVKRTGWSVYANPFDGYVYWSKIAGRGKMILDGDFIRLNTYANDEERKTVVSLHLMAGGPVSVSDQFNTIGNSLWIYQNEELLELNQDGFVGTPLSNDPTNAQCQVWKGQMSNGDWIVGFFNRESSTQTRSINFLSNLGITGNAFVRDLWSHTDLGSVSSLSKSVASHGCQIYRISTNTNKVIAPVMSVKTGAFSSPVSVSISSTTAGTSIYYTLDGSIPTSASNLYSKPLFVSATSTVRAIGIKSGMENSYICKEIYTINLPAPQSAMFIGGTFNTWNLPTLPMTNVGGNNWSAGPVSISAGSHQMKFANSSDWTGTDWGNATGLSGVATISTGGLPNILFPISSTSNYNITFNDATLEYKITNSLTGISEQKSTNKSFILSKSEDHLLISFEKSEKVSIDIFSINGQLLYRTQADSQSIQIHLKSLSDNKLVIIRIILNSNTYLIKQII